jgi:hypothetical protein
MSPPRSNAPCTCRHCNNFVDDPAELENELPGLTALSSARGATRGRAGLCRRQDLWQDPQPTCSGFVARTARRQGRR